MKHERKIMQCEICSAIYEDVGLYGVRDYDFSVCLKGAPTTCPVCGIGEAGKLISKKFSKINPKGTLLTIDERPANIPMSSYVKKWTTPAQRKKIRDEEWQRQTDELADEMDF